MLIDVKTRSAYRAATRSRSIYYFAKRCTDVMVSLTLIVLTLPIIITICYLIFRREGRPIFYKRLCAGLDGERFNMYTFRTKTNRSKVIRALPPHPVPKSWKDGVPDQFLFRYSPITTYTSIGLLLEKYRLDCLPLLFHVLLGQMSLVGPAPELDEIASFYNQYQVGRLQVKPGIVGYAQIKNYSSDEHDKKVQADLYYVRNCAYLFDLKIIVRAVSQIFLK